ncbi:MAG TPA: prolipoprotein diacylglyceryl transferase family protein [Acidimicrobiales bacterium]|nr:prolipoprotein diacylglyceryl transferase family protein [Acidimicrobiales bacterium]
MLTSLLAAIPYKTIPVIEIGPFPLRVFGLMVALGMVLGVWFGASYGERYGVSRDTAYSIGTRMVIAGVVGSRITWVLTHLDQIDNPIDVIAVWEGGLQFAGGFLAAIAVGLPTFLRWTRLQRWQLIDGYAVSVVIGAAFGRLGCLAVGEHFGSATDFPLATRWEGAIALPDGEQPLREQALGLGADARPVVEGTTFHNPALYECVSLFLLLGLLWWVLRRRRAAPGTVAGLFLVGYAVQRFTWDTLRVNDERVAGMTGAQWMCLAMVPIGIYVLTKVRAATPALLAAEGASPAGGEGALLADRDGPSADRDGATVDGSVDDGPVDGGGPAPAGQPAGVGEPGRDDPAADEGPGAR